MATSATAVTAGTTFKSWDVIATADADTTIVIPHGFGSAPLKVDSQELSAPGRVSAWFLAGVTSTEITFTKGTGTGSGAVAAQLRVYAELPHSLVR